jgi:hypothetical protein
LRLASSDFLRRFYEFHWAYIPNLAQDLIVIPFAQILPIEPAARIATILAFVATYGGAMLLDYRLNGRHWGLSIFAGIFLYNGAFRFGFINYVTGVGFAILAFSFWPRYRSAALGLGFPVFVVLGIFLMLMHLYGFGLYAVCVGGYELTILWERYRSGAGLRAPDIRMAAAALGTLLLPCATILLSPTLGGADVVRWGTPLWKAEALVSPIFFAQPLVELPMLGLLALLLLAGLVTGALRIHHRMVLALAGFVLLWLAMPRTLFGSNYADYRLLPAACFFLLASLRLDLGRASAMRFAYILLAGFLVLRVGSVMAEWLPEQAIIGEYDQAFAKLPRGSLVLVVAGPPESGSTSSNRRPPLEHVPVFFAAKHEDFVPYIFAGLIPGQQPLSLSPEFVSYAQFSPYPMFARRMARYEYLLTIHSPPFTVPEGLKIEEMARGTTYTLYRIVHAAE